MFAKSVRNVFDDHHLVVRFGRYHVQELAWIGVQAGADLFVHQRDAAWSALDPGPVGVFPDAFQDQPHSCFDF
jgi:hypothetical protein